MLGKPRLINSIKHEHSYDPLCCFLEVGLNIDIIKDEIFFYKQKKQHISVPVVFT